MKVLVCDKIAEDGMQLLKKQGYTVDVKTGMTPEDVAENILGYDAVIVRSATKIKKIAIDKADKLKVIGRAGVGLDNIDAKDAEAKGIKVVNTPAATSISVAELAIGHMLAMARTIPQGTMTMKAGQWEKNALGKKGIELYGKTLGLIGIGRIAQEVAKRAIAMGMKVIAYDKFVASSPMPEVKLVSKDEVIANADFLSLHIPLDKVEGATLTKADFAKMKDGVYLVNAARGGTVDEAALLEALNSGKVAMAGIDVFEKEPTDNKALIDHPNVIVTPHLGASTEEGQLRAGVQIAEKVIQALKG